MSKFYAGMNTGALQDILDQLEDRLWDLEEESGERVGLQNQIFYVCNEIERRTHAA